MQVIAQNETPVPLLQAIGRGSLGYEPVIRRIIAAKLERRRLGIKPDQPALAAFDDQE